MGARMLSCGVALLRAGKLARQNGDEDDVINTQHDLKECASDEREQTGRIEEWIHGGHPWEPD